MLSTAVDEIWDIGALPVNDESIEIIYAASVLEHFSRRQWRDILRHWYTKLEPGGTLRISVPDFDKIIQWYRGHHNMEELLGLLIGGQKDKLDWHGMIFDHDTLVNALTEIGFVNVVRYRWRLVEPGILGIDDYSQAYLPHMDKENGLLMMLNLEAIKSAHLADGK
jgi:SAM-dependent methyltransferase